MCKLPMIAISYCWLEASHPDARGEQLRHIARVLQRLAFGTQSQFDAYYNNYFEDMGVFWE